MNRNVGIRLHVPGLWEAAIAGWVIHLRSGDRTKETIATHVQRLERTARHIGIENPWQVTSADLVQYVGTQAGWDTETRRGHRTSLRVFYEWGTRAGHVPSSPALDLPQIKPKAPSPMPAPDSVYHPARAQADKREDLMLDLAAEHGMRRCEIAVVHTRDDLIEDLQGWSLQVHGKGRKTRVIPLLDATAAKLLALPAGYAFPGNTPEGHISPRWCGALINRLLPGKWTIHKLRHRAATEWWHASEHDLLWVSELLGHSSTAITQVYVWKGNSRGREIITQASSAVEQRRRRGLHAA